MVIHATAAWHTECTWIQIFNLFLYSMHCAYYWHSIKSLEYISVQCYLHLLRQQNPRHCSLASCSEDTSTNHTYRSQLNECKQLFQLSSNSVT